MIHIYSTTSIGSKLPIYHAQDYQAGLCSDVTSDPSSLSLIYSSNLDVSSWTLVAIIPSLPINPSQYPELFV